MVRIPTDRAPTHPGEMLFEEFVRPLGTNAAAIATALRVPPEWIDELIERRRSVTPSLALRLARLLGTSPDFWLNLQMRWDLYRVQNEERVAIDQIQQLPIRLAS